MREFIVLTMPMLTLLALFIAGLGLVTYGLISGYRLFSFVATSQTAEGTIVSVKRSPASGGFRSVVDFRTAQGTHQTFESRMEYDPPAYAEGEKVDVMYQPGAPHLAEIRALPTLWFSSVFTGLMGIVVVFYCGVLLVCSRRRDPSDSDDSVPACRIRLLNEKELTRQPDSRDGKGSPLTPRCQERQGIDHSLPAD